MNTKKITLVFLILCSLVFNGCSRKKSPHIFFILVDTLRNDHISGYGYERKTTPNLDEYSKDMAVFEHAFSPSPWTLPSVISTFTGLYPSQHGALKIYFEEQGPVIEHYDIDLAPLVNSLKDQGYMAAGFITNPWVKHMYII